MNYNEAVEYIHSLLKFGINPGLERMEAMLELLGNPHKRTQFIHVAGTNGKGSCCNMFSNVLIDSGKRVGLFTSPYVVDFCERIQIDGKMISHDDLVKQVEKIVPIVNQLEKRGMQPTEFEVITAIAFDYFACVMCDVVVLEVGLGGLLDSTNVIEKPLLSVIMSVSFDHMNVLGNTIEEIAQQKAGIIKPDSTVVSYPLQNETALSVIMKKCSEKNARLVVPNVSSVSVLSQSVCGSTFVFDQAEYSVEMLGNHQINNAVTVIAGCKQLPFVTDKNIVSGIGRTVVPARMEILSKEPMILLDGGHNEDCAKALHTVMTKHFDGKNIVALIGTMEDKEYNKYLSIVAPHFSKIVATTPDNPRSLDANELKKCADAFCACVVSESDVAKSVDKVMGFLSTADALVVCGSFYLASDVRNIIKTKYFN